MVLAGYISCFWYTANMHQLKTTVLHSQQTWVCCTRRDHHLKQDMANYCLLLLGGVCLKVPGLTIGVDLTMLLKHSSILSCCSEVLADDGVNAVPQALVMRVGPVDRPNISHS